MIEYSCLECDYAQYNAIKKDRDESPYLLKRLNPTLIKASPRSVTILPCIF